MRTLRAVLLAGLLLPGTARATDTFYCSGNNLEIFIHVGSNGAVGDILIGFGEDSISFGETDLEAARLDRPRRTLAVRQRKNPEATHAVAIEARGRRGALTLDGTAHPIVCDWDE